jgi:hypothetical protein
MKTSIKSVTATGIGLMLLQCLTGLVTAEEDGGMFPDDGWIGPVEGGRAHATAAIYISNGARIEENEYSDDEVIISIAEDAEGISGTAAEGVLLTSSDYEATGIVVSDGGYQIGGKKDYYTVYSDILKDYIGTIVIEENKGDKVKENSKEKKFKKPLGTYNTVILFSLDDVVDADAATGSSGIDADNEAVVAIDNTYLQVDGAQRYGDSSYSSSTTIVNDSYFVSTGNAGGFTDDISEPFSNEALLISGTARTNFSISATDTYYFNSTVVAEGWAALSTDSSTGDGLDMYAYNTNAKALNGGYGTYADFGCRVFLYSSDLEAAEIGAIIAKSGRISVLDGNSADESVLKLNKGRKDWSGSTISSGRNAVMLHTPDMMGTGIDAADSGYLEVINSRLETDPRLVSTFDYSSYSDAIQSYVDYVSGDLILIKSTSATIYLEHAELDAYNGVLIHSVLNSDGMGNFLAVGDNEAVDDDGNLLVEPIVVTMKDMRVQGDILHEDYQRNMEVTIETATLEGTIALKSFEAWREFWQVLDVTEANWLPDDAWEGENTLSLTLTDNASWVVTDTSNLTALKVDEGSVIRGLRDRQVVMTVDGVKTEIEAGSYKGDIQLTLCSDHKPECGEKEDKPLEPWR